MEVYGTGKRDCHPYNPKYVKPRKLTSRFHCPFPNISRFTNDSNEDRKDTDGKRSIMNCWDTGAAISRSFRLYSLSRTYTTQDSDTLDENKHESH
jgi:hypothetical protein